MTSNEKGRDKVKRLKKGLKDYLAQDYPIEFQKLPEEEGGGFFACIPDLGRATCVGDGDTLEEAYESLMALKEHLISEAYDAGEDIPQPSPDVDAYSGTFLVRTTRELHYALARHAKAEGVSLNQLVNTRLALGVGKILGSELYSGEQAHSWERQPARLSQRTRAQSRAPVGEQAYA